MSPRRFPSRMQAGSTALLLTLAAGVGVPFAPAAQAQAATPLGVVELSPTPPGDTQAVSPNIALTFDDSGSMSFGYMPDGMRSNSCRSSYTHYGSNKIYYNPAITYAPPLKADGTSFGNVSFTAAPLDGFNSYLGFGGSTVDLSSGYYPTLEWDRDVSHSNNVIDASCIPSGAISGSGKNKKYHAYYTKADGGVVDLTTITAGATVDGKTRTKAEEQQNFANWYSYYRTRNLMTKTAISQAFAKLQNPVRMVWQTIWPGSYEECTQDWRGNETCNTITRAWGRALATSDPIGPFQDVKDVSGNVVTTGNKPDFFTWLFKLESSNGTPDRKAALRAGDYFTLGANDSSRVGTSSDPYWNGLGGTDTKELVCRQNYHVMVTDGYWNESDDEVTDPTKTSDDMSQTPDGKAEKVTEASIYWNMEGTKTKSFANIAYHYWATDLAPGLKDGVSPYLADTSRSLWNQSYDSDKPWDNKEVYFNPKNDPATWQHLVQFVVTLGVDGKRKFPGDYDSLRKGTTKWPQPAADDASAIDDMWHAAINSRGSYTSAGNPAALVDSLSRILSEIGGRGARATTGAVNASVLVSGALGFNAGYDSSNWSGVLQAVTLKEDGSIAGTVWDAGTRLNATAASARQILTSKQKSDGSFDAGMAFTATAAFDDKAKALLMTPAADATATTDTLANRVNYLRGDRTQETAGTMRKRSNLLGAIVNSQAVYVSYPGSGYYNNWPSGSPEAAKGAQSYDSFVADNADRPGTLYVGANDGMLHAFDASLACGATDSKGKCTSYGPGQSADAGGERWAYVPRAVYANLGNFTSNSFKYAPTVDGSPIVRDVFFDDAKWHTLLVGNLRLGGRGVYALDVTDPTAVTEDNAATKVLWEFNADTPAVTDVGDPADLGYTYGQPNIGRLANGKWVALVPTGYYPDCEQTSRPANCETLAAASNKYSALFVLDAQTGEMIAELKTPTDITGVSSFGLGSVVLGDYNNDQIDDVAFAGDLAGNLWRFDLTDKDPANWKVTLAFRPTTQKSRPITVMPRLFPDPGTNRFMVVFGTGKYLGAKDNLSQGMAAQSIYGIRDLLDADGAPYTVKQSDEKLVAQTLTEAEGAGDFEGTTVRKLTSNPMEEDSQGWYIELTTKGSDDKVTNAGERVVVTPAALFATNTVVFSTLIPGSTDPCNPVVQGSVMFIDITNGGPGSGVSLLGGYPYVGARVDNVRTSGSLPVTTTVGGGKTVLPGLTLTGRKDKPNEPISGDAPIWRRRSWSELNHAQ